MSNGQAENHNSLSHEMIRDREAREQERSGGPACNKTLRDEIAMNVLAALVSGKTPREIEHLSDTQGGLVNISYQYADRMIAQGRK